jgi:hypothetical protein
VTPESLSPEHGKIRNLLYQNKHLGECLTHFENKTCETSQSETSPSLSISVSLHPSQCDAKVQRLPPAEEENEQAEKAQRATKPSSRSSSESAGLRPNKGQLPTEEASYLAPATQPSHSSTATTEWRNLSARYGPPARECSKPASAAHQRPTTHDAERSPQREGGATYISGANTPSPSTVDEPPDELNGLVQALAADYISSSSWTDFVEKFRGQEGDFHPQVKRIPHAAAELLEDLRVTRAKVTLSTPKWTMAQKEAALARGPHQSAHAHTAFL